jgi:hypothetical protein
MLNIVGDPQLEAHIFLYTLGSTAIDEVLGGNPRFRYMKVSRHR